MPGGGTAGSRGQPCRETQPATHAGTHTLTYIMCKCVLLVFSCVGVRVDWIDVDRIALFTCCIQELISTLSSIFSLSLSLCSLVLPVSVWKIWTWRRWHWYWVVLWAATELETRAGPSLVRALCPLLLRRKLGLRHNHSCAQHWRCVCECCTLFTL